MNHIAASILNWIASIENASGTTPDLSALVQFAFYKPLYSYNAEYSFLYTQEIYQRLLGLAGNVGDTLAYYVVTKNNTVTA